MGGAEILTVELLNYMCINNDVTLIIVNNNWDNQLLKQIDRRVKLFFIKRRIGSPNPIPIIDLNILLYRLKPDIIHCHDSKMGKLIRISGAKIVYTIHAMGIPVDSYHHYDLLIAISDAVHNDVSSKCITSLKTIYNGINVAAFKCRLNYDYQEGEPFKIVQVSRLNHENKGQDILLYALAQLKKEHKVNIVYDMIGKGESREYLQELIYQLGLEGSANLIGEKDREWLYSNLSNYHLLVQPSRYEGFGLTILEGLAAGIPVLASDIDGPGEIVRKTTGGLLFVNGDVQSCADAILQILEMYKAGEAAEFMSQVIDLKQTDFTLESCAKRYYNEYQGLVTSSLGVN
jgi:glycosyltransferase involved in cell wall biosynthesis